MPPPGTPAVGRALAPASDSMRPSGPGAAPVELSLPVQTGQRTRARGEQPKKTPSRARASCSASSSSRARRRRAAVHEARRVRLPHDRRHAPREGLRVVCTSSQSAARADPRRTRTSFPETRGAVDDLFAAHWQMPRATARSRAYAAFAEFAYETRFGRGRRPQREGEADPRRRRGIAGREVRLRARDAAQDAAVRQTSTTRAKALDAASKRDRGRSDPARRRAAPRRGRARRARRAAPRRPRSRPRSSSARTRRRTTGSRASRCSPRLDRPSRTECDATLAATPHHPGALLLRAMQRYTAKGDDTDALADLTEITEGAAKPLASKQEVAQALANRGRIFLASGRAGDARNAFDDALKVDPRNVDALVGQGTVFYPREPLHRGAHALRHRAPRATQRRDRDRATTRSRRSSSSASRTRRTSSSPRARSSRSLRASCSRSPKPRSRSATAATPRRTSARPSTSPTPKDPESVEPYIALATLLAAQNRDKDAKRVIEDAKRSCRTKRRSRVAFGEYDAAQGRLRGRRRPLQARARAQPDEPLDALQARRHVPSHAQARSRGHRVRSGPRRSTRTTRASRSSAASSSRSRARWSGRSSSSRTPSRARPTDADLQLRVGAAYVAIGRPTEALPMLRKVLEKRPTSAEANHYLGRAIFADARRDAGGDALS